MNPSISNIANLVRKIALESDFSDKTNGGLYEQIKLICFDFLLKTNYRYGNQDSHAKELASDVYEKFIINLHLPMWQEVSIKNDENDKRIIGYFYTLVSRSYNKNFSVIQNQNSNFLYSAVSDACKQLTKEKSISDYKNYYKFSQTEGCKNYYNGQIKGIYCNIRKGEESLDHELLRWFIVQILEDMEETCFTLSDITKIVSENSNFGNYTTPEHRKPLYNYSEESEEWKLDEIIDSESSNVIPNDDVLNSWLIDFRTIYRTNEKRLQAALIMILYFEHDFTLNEISDVLAENNLAAMKSTVKNRIDRTILGIGFNKYDYQEHEIEHYLAMFLVELQKQFIPSKILKKALKKKNDKLTS